MSEIPIKFSEAMEDCARVYGKPMTAKTINAYAKYLRGHCLEDCADAVEKLGSESQYFPKPYQIIAELDVPEPEERAPAPFDEWLMPSEEAWEKLKRAIQGGGRHMDFADHIAQKALEEWGFAEYAKLQDAPISAWTKAKMTFVRHYQKHAYTEHVNGR